MILKFHAYTDVAQYALLDPACVPDVMKGKEGPLSKFKDFDAALSRYSEEGKLFLFQDDGDGDLHMWVFVGVEPDERLISRAFNHFSGSRLSVPCGRLVFCGTEQIYAGELAELDVPAGTSVHSLPIGEYQLSAFETCWEEYEIDERIAELLEERLGSAAAAAVRKSSRIVGNGCGISCLGLLVAVLGAGAAIITPWTYLWFVALGGLALVGAGWLWTSVFGQNPDHKAAAEIESEVGLEFPWLVVVLTPMSSPQTGEYAASRMTRATRT